MAGSVTGALLPNGSWSAAISPRSDANSQSQGSFAAHHANIAYCRNCTEKNSAPELGFKGTKVQSLSCKASMPGVLVPCGVICQISWAAGCSVRLRGDSQTTGVSASSLSCVTYFEFPRKPSVLISQRSFSARAESDRPRSSAGQSDAKTEGKHSITETDELKNSRLEKLWEKYFEDPSQWWDNRTRKRNPNYPDFKHKVTTEALWVDRRSNPAWVMRKLKANKQGKVQPGSGPTSQVDLDSSEEKSSSVSSQSDGERCEEDVRADLD